MPRESPPPEPLLRRLLSSRDRIDTPQLAPGVQMLDLSIASRALGRTVAVRTVFPMNLPPPGLKLPLIYLLPDESGDFRTWTNLSEVTALAASGAVLVMPDATGTFYLDDRLGWTGYYEHFFTNELAPLVQGRLPVASRERESTALIGVSQGGYGALLLGLKHPARFGFIGALSSPVDLPRRPFGWLTPLQSLAQRRTFGPAGGAIRQANDPFLLARAIGPAQSPFFWLSCGSRDRRLASNRLFRSVLEEQALPHAWSEPAGGGNWSVWDAQLPSLGSALIAFFSRTLADLPAISPGEEPNA